MHLGQCDLPGPANLLLHEEARFVPLRPTELEQWLQQVGHHTDTKALSQQLLSLRLTQRPSCRNTHTREDNRLLLTTHIILLLRLFFFSLSRERGGSDDFYLPLNVTFV